MPHVGDRLPSNDGEKAKGAPGHEGAPQTPYRRRTAARNNTIARPKAKRRIRKNINHYEKRQAIGQEACSAGEMRIHEPQMVPL